MAENPFTKARQGLIAELEGLLATKLGVGNLAIASYVADTMEPGGDPGLSDEPVAREASL